MHGGVCLLRLLDDDQEQPLIETTLGVFLFVTVLAVGLAVDHARSVTRNVQSAWTLLVPRQRAASKRTKERRKLLRVLPTLLKSMSRLLNFRERVLIFGADRAGTRLAWALAGHRDIKVIGLLDYDVDPRNASVDGLKVYDACSVSELVRRHRVSRVLLATSSSSANSRARVIGELEDLSVHVQSIPSMAELAAGVARIDDLRELDIVDILGRRKSVAELSSIGKTIGGLSVMVTGAGGSIGTELCLQIVKLGAVRLVLFDISEIALYTVNRQVLEVAALESPDIEVIPLLGSVDDRDRMEEALKAFAVDTVYHAAAYKHVPLVEYNMIEGVSNNVLGTLHAAEAAIAAGVKYFVLISTDKAVHPTSVVGASKRLAEQVIQGLNDCDTATIFAMVRFGNALGSSGSVVHQFHEQIRGGGPVTITHKDIIRYFMTISEAASLVLQAASLAESGEVYILDMGEPVRIADMAEKMIRMSGLSVRNDDNPRGDIQIVYTGLRPAEKLYEELLIGSDVIGTEHPRIMIAKEDHVVWNVLSPLLTNLSIACEQLDRSEVRRLLVEAVPEYLPTEDVEDHVWRQLPEPESLEGLGSPRIVENAKGKPTGLKNIIQIKDYQTG